MTFDELRAAYPALGVALYALDPAGAVTLEIYPPDGSVFAFRGDTAEAAIAAAFPPAPPPTEIPLDLFG